VDVAPAPAEGEVSAEPQHSLRKQAEAAIRTVLARPSLEIVRTTKKGERAVDIRPFVDSLELCECDADRFRVRMQVGAAPEAMAKPAEVVAALAAELGELEVLHIHRVALTGRRRRDT
jgi:hypothetical protein